jgi:hypothetical protein
MFFLTLEENYVMVPRLVSENPESKQQTAQNVTLYSLAVMF